jgi:hypothetical protein
MWRNELDLFGAANVDMSSFGAGGNGWRQAIEFSRNEANPRICTEGAEHSVYETRQECIEFCSRRVRILGSQDGRKSAAVFTAINEA